MYTEYVMGDLLGKNVPPLTRSASEGAVEIIRDAILDGRLAPGERLKEGRLAEDLRISRTPVREAIRALQAEGLIEFTSYQGASVRAYDADDLDDMYRLRALLEGYAAACAADRITSEDLRALTESCDRLSALGPNADVKELGAENLVFHNTILTAAGSERLTGFLRSVIEVPLVYKSYIWFSPNQKMASEHAHREIVEALAARDGAAADRLMKSHIHAARSTLLAHLKALRANDATDAGGLQRNDVGLVQSPAEPRLASQADVTQPT